MSGTPVYVNIYKLIVEDGKSKELSNEALERIGMGIYHAGVEVLDQEWSFGMDLSGSKDPNKDGVFVCRPKKAVGDFKEQVLLGHVKPELTPAKVKMVLDSIRPKWKAVTYHILNHNCCYFSLDFAKTLNPEFDKTFPHYCYKAASVGDTALPAAMVDSLTKALGPPAPLPTNLIGKIDAPCQGSVPAPLPPKAPKEEKSSGGGGGFMGMASGLASKVTTTVKAVVPDFDKKKMAELFPDLPADSLISAHKCHVRHIHLEQEAHLFVTTKCLAIGGENKLAVKIQWNNIQTLSYGYVKQPTVKGLPPTFEPQKEEPPKDAALFMFLKSPAQMVPFFDFPRALVGKSKLEEAFIAMDTEWRKNVKV